MTVGWQYDVQIAIERHNCEHLGRYTDGWGRGAGWLHRPQYLLCRASTFRTIAIVEMVAPIQNKNLRTCYNKQRWRVRTPSRSLKVVQGLVSLQFAHQFDVLSLPSSRQTCHEKIPTCPQGHWHELWIGIALPDEECKSSAWFFTPRTGILCMHPKDVSSVIVKEHVVGPGLSCWVLYNIPEVKQD